MLKKSRINLTVKRWQVVYLPKIIKRCCVYRLMLLGVIVLIKFPVFAADMGKESRHGVAASNIVAVAETAVVIDASKTAAIAAKKPWRDVVSSARGQTVYFHAWGGDAKINAYIRWAAGQLKQQFNIQLVHVKASNTSNIIATLMAEKAAGRTSAGRADLVWINGENFHSMKEAGLLFGPFAEQLPNSRLVDTEGKPATVIDFTVPTQGFESPWGYAQLTFFHDSAQLSEPPRSAAALLQWAKNNPGRFAYPAPPDFVGTTFLKQVLLELSADHSLFAEPPSDEIFIRASKPLWVYLDQLHASLWRSGRTFAANATSLRQMLGDGEVDIAFSFNPADAVSAIAQGILPATVRPYIFSGGTITNAHFVAIPYNSSVKAAGMVTANYLLSPKAQAHKADPRVWGDTSVLALQRLDPAMQRVFNALPSSESLLSTHALQQTLSEPHPDWTVKLEREWLKRYGR